MDTKVCTECGEEKPVTSFAPCWKQGKRTQYRRRICNKCLYPEQVSSRKRSRTKRRLECPARFICQDSKASDRKKGREGNNLDRDFVENLISQGCSYCGNRELRMTLDRIDNSKAHTKDNVIPACLRCNYIRNDMPYEAWMRMVPVVKQLTEEGLFEDWRTKPW